MNLDLNLPLNERVFTNINSYTKVIDINEDGKEYFKYLPLIPENYDNEDYPKLYFINGEEYLREKYGFSEHYIKGSKQFATILEVNTISINELKHLLQIEKQTFVDNQGFCDLNIFKQHNVGLASLVSNLKEYLNSIRSGKVIDWFPHLPKKKDIDEGLYEDKPFKPERFCYWIKSKDGSVTNNFESLLITSLTLPQLQHYFSSILGLINDYFEEEQITQIEEEQVDGKTPKWTFNNNFDSVSPEKVYAHFYEMVEKKWLTKEELMEFLTSAFDKQIVPDQLFSIKNSPTKKRVTDTFFSYFKNVAGSPYGKKRKYVELLGEYFEGYKSSTIMTNFSR